MAKKKTTITAKASVTKPVEKPKTSEPTSTKSQSENAPTTAFVKPKRPVSRVFVHCSASDNPAHDNIETITQWHIRRGFRTVGYHYFIRKDGTVEVGRNIEDIPAAQQGNNTGTIAICLHGLQKDKFTKEQFTSLIDLCSSIKKAYGGNITFHGHREVAAKECPVFDYKKVLNLDEKGNMV